MQSPGLQEACKSDEERGATELRETADERNHRVKSEEQRPSFCLVPSQRRVDVYTVSGKMYTSICTFEGHQP
jgi:hypothetical protein